MGIQASVVSRKYLYTDDREKIAAVEPGGNPSRRRLGRRRLLRVSGYVVGLASQLPLTLSRPRLFRGRVEWCRLGKTQRTEHLVIWKAKYETLH